ncbi:hypothetical protein LT493_05910 [Streptomyces tricolor]|nr:hypothetical protein [Streptomyces tricolor]
MLPIAGLLFLGAPWIPGRVRRGLRGRGDPAAALVRGRRGAADRDGDPLRGAARAEPYRRTRLAPGPVALLVLGLTLLLLAPDGADRAGVAEIASLAVIVAIATPALWRTVQSAPAGLPETAAPDGDLADLGTLSRSRPGPRWARDAGTPGPRCPRGRPPGSGLTGCPDRRTPAGRAAGAGARGRRTGERRGAAGRAPAAAVPGRGRPRLSARYRRAGGCTGCRRCGSARPIWTGWAGWGWCRCCRCRRWPGPPCWSPSSPRCSGCATSHRALLLLTLVATVVSPARAARGDRTRAAVPDTPSSTWASSDHIDPHRIRRADLDARGAGRASSRWPRSSAGPAGSATSRRSSAGGRR